MTDLPFILHVALDKLSGVAVGREREITEVNI